LYKHVYSVEIIPELAEKARLKIQDLRFKNIKIQIRDGKKGWSEYAPYDAIICGADAQEIPTAWLDQLTVGGRIVCPVKGRMTRMTKIQNPNDFKIETFEDYVFVPLV
jgi:protein-L-isoaspartate(D-aspartate) O-methyltransferase